MYVDEKRWRTDDATRPSKTPESWNSKGKGKAKTIPAFKLALDMMRWDRISTRKICWNVQAEREKQQIHIVHRFYLETLNGENHGRTNLHYITNIQRKKTGYNTLSIHSVSATQALGIAQTLSSLLVTLYTILLFYYQNSILHLLFNTTKVFFLEVFIPQHSMGYLQIFQLLLLSNVENQTQLP